MRVTLFFCAIWIGSLVGCGTQDEITRYTISVPQGPSDIQPAGSEMVQNAVKEMGPTRMLGAIIPQGKETWFFKMTGPDEMVAKQQDLFSTLVKSVRFIGESSLPTWDLPGEWRQQGSSGMRYATIEIKEGERTLELTVIPLGTMGQIDEYVLENINRWRGQLGLARVAAIQPADDSDTSSSVRQFNLSDTTIATTVNLVGQGSGSDVIGAGFDMTNHPPIDDASPSTPAESNDNAEFTYTTPEGWTAMKVSGMRRAAFEVIDGAKKVEITVISLSLAGGERLSNVNRWREQIGLGNTTAEQLAKELTKISLANAVGDHIDMVGPKEATPRESILAVLTDVGADTWFLKLKGDAELAARERERFLAFVHSVRFSELDGANDE